MPVHKRFPASSDSSFRDDEQPQSCPDSIQSLDSVGYKINGLGHNTKNKPLKSDETWTSGKNGHVGGLVKVTKRQSTDYKCPHDEVNVKEEDSYSQKKRQRLTDLKCATNEMRQAAPIQEKDAWTNNSLSQSMPIPVNSASNVSPPCSRKNILLNWHFLELPNSSWACQSSQPYSKKSILLNRHYTKQSQLFHGTNKTISDKQRNSQNDQGSISNVDQLRPRLERVSGILQPGHQLENVYTIWQPPPTLFVPPTALINDQDDTVPSRNNVVDRIRYVNVMEEDDRDVMDTMMVIFQTSMMSNEE